MNDQSLKQLVKNVEKLCNTQKDVGVIQNNDEFQIRESPTPHDEDIIEVYNAIGNKHSLISETKPTLSHT